MVKYVLRSLGIYCICRRIYRAFHNFLRYYKHL